MAKKKSKAKSKVMGRPVKKLEDLSIDGWTLLNSLIIWSAHSEYIADQLGISEDTLSKRIKEKHGVTFTEYRNKQKEKIRINLAKKQYDVAISGNPTMLIWLGKNELGQADKNEIEQTNKNIEIHISEDDSNL